MPIDVLAYEHLMCAQSGDTDFFFFFPGLPKSVTKPLSLFSVSKKTQNWRSK